MKSSGWWRIYSGNGGVNSEKLLRDEMRSNVGEQSAIGAVGSNSVGGYSISRRPIKLIEQ